jgi:hypothetical protein
VNGDKQLIVPLPASGEPARYLLSLQYRIPTFRFGQGIANFELPRIGNGAWTDQFYWQLLLPAEEHLLSTPRGLTSEFAWRWNSFYLGRQPVMDEADLATWVGLPRSAVGYPTTGLNCYLFSALSPLESCDIATIGRTTMVFVASGIVLLVGLSLIYLRAARHPLFLLMAAILLAGGATLYPELALLAAQASVVGLVATLLALALHRWLSVDRSTTIPDIASSVTLALHVAPPSVSPSVPSVHVAAPAASSKTVALPLPSDAAT